MKLYEYKLTSNSPNDDRIFEGYVLAKNEKKARQWIYRNYPIVMEGVELFLKDAKNIIIMKEGIK